MALLHGWTRQTGIESQLEYVRETVGADQGSASFEGLSATARRQMKKCAEILHGEGYRADVFGKRGDARSVLTVTAPGARPRSAARYDL